MNPPTLCVIHECIGRYNAIAKIAQAGVEAALEAGWRVTVVAELLEPELRDRVEWLRLYVPPRGFALKWLTARRFIRKALGDRRFDVVHAHQPQVADLADVFQCHYLTRVAAEHGGLTTGRGLRSLAWRLQNELVMRFEDRLFSRWNPATHLLFNSDLTGREFARLYGRPPRAGTMLYPSDRFDPPAPDRRRVARAALLGPDFGDDHPVAGFLGGLDKRKGYERILPALRGERDIFLLMAGAHSNGFAPPELTGHFRAIGPQADTEPLYAAMDVLLVPSLFEPFGLVATEAAARGVPTVATDGVGALPHLLEFGAGERWDPAQPLGPLIRRIAGNRAGYAEACRALVESTSRAESARRLLGVYEAVLADGRPSRPAGERAGV